MTDFSHEIMPTAARSMEDIHARQQLTAADKPITLPLHNISNTSIASPDLFRVVFPLPEKALWMTSEAASAMPQQPDISAADSRRSSKTYTQPEPVTEAEYTYQPSEFPIEENPKNNQSALKMTRFHDVITRVLSRNESELRKSAHYNISKYAADCSQLIRQESKVTQQLRDKASEAFQQQKRLVMQAASELNNEKITTLIDQIAAICDPSKELTHCYKKARALFYKACEQCAPYLLWEYLSDNEQLRGYLEGSDFGQDILAQLDAIPPESDDCERFTAPQLQLINKIFAFCKPIDGLYLHDIYQLDLAGKNAHAIIHRLLNNKCIREILHDSYYGQRLWQELMNFPVIIDMFNHHQKIQHSREKIAQQQEKLDNLQRRSVVSRVLNAWQINHRSRKIRKMKHQLKEELHVRQEIILCKDNFFQYIHNIAQGDTYKALRELSREDITLQNNIDKVISLAESAEKVTPTFLYRETKMVPFIHIARALTLADVFTRNMGSSIETLTNAILQLYPASQNAGQFIRSLQNPADELPLILANGYLLPPHTSWQERQRKMRLLSQVIMAREQPLPPVTDPLRRAYMARPEEWCAEWSDPLDDHTLQATVNVWFDHQRPPAQDDILLRISNKLATSLDPDTLARNLMVPVVLDKTLTEKLKLKPAVQNTIKQQMLAFMLAQGDYADPALRNARFRLNIAGLTGKLAEKLAWDLEKIGLTAAHFREQKFTDEDRLLTDKHLQTLDHLILFDAAIRNCIEARNALDELHDIYRDVYNDEQELEPLYELMEDILLGDKQRLADFHQRVSETLNENNIEYFSYFDPEFYDTLKTIRQTLLAFSSEGFGALFTTMAATGITLTDANKDQISTTLCNYLFDESRREGKSASRVLSLLFYNLFSHHHIAELPAPETISHPHEYLDNFSCRLIADMEKIIDGEISRIMADFPVAGPKNVAYLNACCQLINQPEQEQNILNTLTAQPAEEKKLSPREYNLLRNALKTILTNNPAGYQNAASQLICTLQQQRADEDLYWLASMVYWHDYFSLRRAAYLAVNSDLQRKKETESIYNLNHYLFLDELASDYDQWRAATDSVSGKLREFIRFVDQSNHISGSLAYQITLMNKALTGALLKLSEEKRREHQRAVNNMNLRIGLTVHYYEMEWQRQKYNREKLWRDMQTRHEKEVESQNKYIVRDWKNRTLQHVAESLALQREMEWAFQREQKIKREHAITKTTRAMAHAWRNREVYVVVGAKIGHTSRVIIHNSSGPVNHHDTYDEDISPTYYYVVKIKARDFDDGVRDMFSSMKPAHGAPRAAKSWRPKPGEAPTVDGRRLMKIIIEKTDQIDHQVFGVFSRYGDIPVKVNKPTPDLDAMMEAVKAAYLHKPGREQIRPTRDNAVVTGQSTALPGAENALVLAPSSSLFPPEWRFSEPEMPQTSPLPPIPPLSEPAPEERPNLIDQFPLSTQMAEQIISPLGWLGDHAEQLPYLISRTEMFENKILVITDNQGKVIEAYDSASGDTFPKSQLATTQKTIAAIRLDGEHYDPWLPDNAREKHRFVTVQERRQVTGATPATGSVHYLDTGKSTLRKIRGDGFCMTDAAAIALDLNYGLFTGAQLRGQLVKALSSGQYEALLQQPTFYNQSH